MPAAPWTATSRRTSAATCIDGPGLDPSVVDLDVVQDGAGTVEDGHRGAGRVETAHDEAGDGDGRGGEGQRADLDAAGAVLGAQVHVLVEVDLFGVAARRRR